MIHKIYALFSLVCLFSTLSPFQYDTAVSMAYNGKWADAYEKLHAVLVDHPDSADVLYDAGVAAYNLRKFTQASAYFDRAAEHSQNRELKKHSLFNAGNASVACQRLQEAIKFYDAALVID